MTARIFFDKLQRLVLDEIHERLGLIESGTSVRTDSTIESTAFVDLEPPEVLVLHSNLYWPGRFCCFAANHISNRQYSCRNT
jgi:hypothetical protein